MLIAVIANAKMGDATVRQLAILTGAAERPRTVRELASELKLAKPSISRCADKLEYIGYLKRLDDPNDRRSVLLSLTKAGQNFLAQIDRA